MTMLFDARFFLAKFQFGREVDNLLSMSLPITAFSTITKKRGVL